MSASIPAGALLVGMVGVSSINAPQTAPMPATVVLFANNPVTGGWSVLPGPTSSQNAVARNAAAAAEWAYGVQLAADVSGVYPASGSPAYFQTVAAADAPQNAPSPPPTVTYSGLPASLANTQLVAGSPGVWFGHLYVNSDGTATASNTPSLAVVELALMLARSVPAQVG